MEKILFQFLLVRKTMQMSCVSISYLKDNLTKEERTSIHQFVRSVDVNLKSELVNGAIQVVYQRK